MRLLVRLCLGWASFSPSPLHLFRFHCPFWGCGNQNWTQYSRCGLTINLYNIGAGPSRRLVNRPSHPLTTACRAPSIVVVVGQEYLQYSKETSTSHVCRWSIPCHILSIARLWEAELLLLLGYGCCRRELRFSCDHTSTQKVDGAHLKESFCARSPSCF